MEPNMKIIFMTVIACCTIRQIDCLTCLSCRDVPAARDCTTVVQCGSHEECYADQIVTDSGRILRNFGCRDRLQCAATGKRHLPSVLERRSSSGLTICSQCCQHDLCQAKMCGDSHYQAGPVCFNCDQFVGSCDLVRECGSSSVCYTSLATTAATGDRILKSGCMEAQACARVEASLIGRRSLVSQGSCFKCCHDNLCNDGNCGNVTGVATVTGPAVTSAPCVDHTHTSTCTIAAPVVCNDRKMAQNAGCLHHCGFC